MILKYNSFHSLIPFTTPLVTTNHKQFHFVLLNNVYLIANPLLYSNE